MCVTCWWCCSEFENGVVGLSLAVLVSAAVSAVLVVLWCSDIAVDWWSRFGGVAVDLGLVVLLEVGQLEM